LGPELPEFCLRTKKLRKNCGNFDLLSLSINGGSINQLVDQWGVDQSGVDQSGVDQSGVDQWAVNH
jgi:hypothetical protein